MIPIRSLVWPNFLPSGVNLPVHPVRFLSLGVKERTPPLAKELPYFPQRHPESRIRLVPFDKFPALASINDLGSR